MNTDDSRVQWHCLSESPEFILFILSKLFLPSAFCLIWISSAPKSASSAGRS
jgi:hypothetical protein